MYGLRLMLCGVAKVLRLAETPRGHLILPVKKPSDEIGKAKCTLNHQGLLLPPLWYL